MGYSLGKDDLFTTNPLFWSLDGSNDFVPAYSHIKPEHFEPAIDHVLAETRRHVKIIRDNPEPPTFENTIEVLDFVHTRYQYVHDVFDHMAQVRRTPEMEALEKSFEIRKAAYMDSLHFDGGLFKRVKAVYAQKESLDLNPEQAALLEFVYNKFFMNGAALPAVQKKKIYSINQTLAKLGSEYDSMMLKYTESGQILVEDRADLKGIAKNIVAGAADLAEKSGQKGKWLFKGDDETWWHLATNAKSRSLRERLFESTYDTDKMLKVIRQMLSLRYDRARLLGFRSHTEYRLKGRMVTSKQEITDFLDNLKRHTKSSVSREDAMLRRAAREDGLEKMGRADRYYYEERLREKVLGLGDKKLRPYFKVDNVLGGAFGLANELFGLSFVKNDAIDKWHDDVDCYDVIDTKTGKKVAILQLDLYSRPEKAGHAWCTTTLAAGMFEGRSAIPIIPLVCNFRKSTDDEPSLASLDNVRTFFHEFGHAIQALITRTKYQTLSGFNNIPLDQIELFSQIYENWATEPAVLDRFARHYKTGARMPASLKAKIQKSAGFMGGNTMKFALEITYLDLALHSRSLKKMSVENYELNYLNKIFPGRSREGVITPVFQHIATYGYDAGYYAYIWSEALDADAFEMFREKGVFDKESAEKLRVFMANASTLDPASNYIAFRGRPVSPEALLKRYNLSSAFNKAANTQFAPEQDNVLQPAIPTRSRKPAP